jgi:hypothetical protein
MQRRYEPIDLIVGIGMSATIVGAFLVFLAAGWTLEAGTSSGQTSVGSGLGAVAGQSGLQVPLGQAIVESYVLQREGAAASQTAAMELNKARSIQRWLADSAMNYLDPIRRDAAQMEADHAGRVQSVLGREIVNFTRRGVGSEAFASPQSAAAYNSRMLGLVDATRMRMEEDFRLNRQPNLDRAIMTAGRDRREALAQVQRRMGRAQTVVATTEAGYAQATGANQQQLGHLIVAAIREEYRMDATPRPAETVVPAQQPLVLTSELRTWPEIPIGYLLAASAGLLGLFLAGLRLSAALEVRRLTEVVNLQTVRAIYRETIYPSEIGKGVLASR